MPDLNHESVEHTVPVLLRDGSTLLLRISIAAAPAIGGGKGPQPGPGKKGELFLAVAVNEEEVLSIGGTLFPPAAAPAIGGGIGPS